MTTVHQSNRDELLARRAAIFARLGVSEAEFRSRVETGALAGNEWDAWSELQNIDYLLGE